MDRSVRMTSEERLLLNRMVTESGVEDQTPLIRQLKHSAIFREEIATLQQLMAERKQRTEAGEVVTDEMFDLDVMVHCNFMHKYYTDLYHKIAREDMDMVLLGHLIDELELIEKGEVDMHEAAYRVGKLTQKMYITSALSAAGKRDAAASSSSSSSSSSPTSTSTPAAASSSPFVPDAPVLTYAEWKRNKQLAFLHQQQQP